MRTVRTTHIDPEVLERIRVRQDELHATGRELTAEDILDELIGPKPMRSNICAIPPSNTADKKLAALLERQSNLKAAVKAVRDRQKAAAEREAERLADIVGRAVLAYIARQPEFAPSLRVALTASVTEGEREYSLLKAKGLI